MAIQEGFKQESIYRLSTETKKKVLCGVVAVVERWPLDFSEGLTVLLLFRESRVWEYNVP